VYKQTAKTLVACAAKCCRGQRRVWVIFN